MQVIQGGLRRRKNHSHAAWCALAISAVALAFPATALAAQGRGRLTTIAADAAPSGGAPLDQRALALGSGYGRPDGSPQVRAVQRDLAQGGYPSGAIDGLYGPGTRQAVIAFQTSHGLRVDGVVGPHTWAALNEPGPILGPGAGHQPGGSNVVRSLQRRLALAGYSPGPIDGRFGALTEGAVRRFQLAHGLPLSGVAGPRMLGLLSGSAQPLRRRNPVRSRSGRSVRRPNPSLPQATPPLPRTNTGSQAPGSSAVSSPRRTPGSPGRRAAGHRAAGHRAAGQRHASGAVPEWIILGGLAFALALMIAAPLLIAAVRRPRSRGGDRSHVALSAGSGADSAAAVEPTDATLATGQVGAAARANGTRTAGTNGARTVGTNGGRIQTNGDGPRHDPDETPQHADGRSSGAERWVLPESDEAANAFNRGLLLEAHGSMLEAEAAYRRADECGHGIAASNLGRLLEERGALAEAEAAYRRADERGDSAGAFNLAALLEDRNALEEAAAAYRRAAGRGHGPAASNLGVLLEEQGALDEAEAAYRRGDERGDPTAAFNLAVLLEERGALTEAEQTYHRAAQRGDGEVANMARAALLDLRAGLRETGIGPTGRVGDA